MSSDSKTARRADDQWRSVGDVSVPYRRPEHTLYFMICIYIYDVHNNSVLQQTTCKYCSQKKGRI